MAEIPSSPASAGDPVVNIHSAAPSQQPESESSEVNDTSKDEDTLKALEEDIERDHVPHIGATG